MANIAHLINRIRRAAHVFRTRAPFYLFVVVMLVSGGLSLVSCGESYEERQRITRAERQRLAREDSAALKVGVLPTLDCLPIYLAKERRLFDTLGVDIRPKQFTSQLDCQEALKKGSIEGGVTDLVRAERMIRRGTPLQYMTATNTYWQMVSNRMARVNELKQMVDKMVAITNHSATDMLTQMWIDSCKLKQTDVFRIPVNDVHVRMLMLHNNEMDAVMLTEPQATEAQLFKHSVLRDSRKSDLRLGAIVFRSKDLTDKNRSKQYKAFVKAYNQACDSINQKGLQHYAGLIEKYMKADEKVIKALPKLRFEHASQPRQKDIEAARKWLGK